jgi:hypothetical protein
MRSLRSVAIMTAITALTIVGIGGFGDAGAHSDTGMLSVEASPGPDDRTVKVSAVLKYVNDGDPVTGADVTVFAANSNDEATAPSTLTDVGLGGYQGTLKLPSAGSWTLNVRAENPAATSTTTVTVVDEGDAAPDPMSTGAASDDDDESTIQIVAVVVIAAAVLASAIVLLRRRRVR